MKNGKVSTVSCNAKSIYHELMGHLMKRNYLGWCKSKLMHLVIFMCNVFILFCANKAAQERKRTPELFTIDDLNQICVLLHFN